uniref:Uncharacterized protein n=1 Tax=Tanacetum cinerariifolium TaxID=118510 RepID=A0A6L2NSN3_TANCI|nr:hypothetical protein [Tanacetum cinerariifolium]
MGQKRGKNPIKEDESEVSVDVSESIVDKSCRNHHKFLVFLHTCILCSKHSNTNRPYCNDNENHHRIHFRQPKTTPANRRSTGKPASGGNPPKQSPDPTRVIPFNATGDTYLGYVFPLPFLSSTVP